MAPGRLAHQNHVGVNAVGIGSGSIFSEKANGRLHVMYRFDDGIEHHFLVGENE